MEEETTRQPAAQESPRPPRTSTSGERQGSRSGGKPGFGAGAAPGNPRAQESGASSRRKSSNRYAGWGDGIDRVWCTARLQEPAQGFPVHSRIAATRPVVVVDRREGEVLLCDGEHWGDHRWPHLPIDECPVE
jgi:hypothetical protein